MARAAAAARPADGAQGQDAAAAVAGVLPAGVPDRHDQVLDPARLGDAERGRRGRRLRRDPAAALLAGRLNFKMLEDESATSSARTIAMVFFIIISATCFAYVYRALGGDDIVEKLIREAGLSSWGFLFLIMGIVFFLGFFLDWIEITLIVLPVFAPMISDARLRRPRAARPTSCYWFAILMAVNLQTSFLTPPFGFALFYLKGIAPKEVKIQSIYLGIIPFVILQLMGLIVVMIVAATSRCGSCAARTELRENDPCRRRISPRPTRQAMSRRRSRSSNAAARHRRLRRPLGRVVHRAAGARHGASTSWPASSRSVAPTATSTACRSG